MLLLANLAKKPEKVTEPLVHRYSSQSSQGELSKEYHHNRVWMVFENLCVLVLWREVALSLKGLTLPMLRMLLSKTQG